MRTFGLLLSLLVVLVATPRAGELLITGGTILIAKEEGIAEIDALLSRDGEVVAHGAAAVEQADPAAQILDLKGAVAMPALVDAHAHLFNLGRLLTSADLRGATSLEECLDRLAAVEATLPEGAWLRGRGWDQNLFADGAWPTRIDLDARFGDRPACIDRVDGHAVWVSSAALERAGLDATVGDPPGGELLRDSGGELLGILVDEAEKLVLSAIPAESPEELDHVLAVATRDAVRKGLGGIHEMGIDAAELAALRRAEAAGRLPLRVVTYLGGMEVLRDFDGGPERDPAARLRIEGVKLYLDGALGSRGATLLEEYSDRPGHHGLWVSDPTLLPSSLEEVSSRGLGVAVHAIGDAANRAALDAMATHWPTDGVPRPRIEHAQLIAPEDRGRFAELHVLPSMQPTHCTSDMPWAPDRGGDHRRDGLYAWRQLRADGNVLPLGSDFPVEGVSPLLGLSAAISRQQPDGTPPGGFDAHEALTPTEALLGFTRWPASALGEAAWGHLQVGGRCDVTVLAADPRTTPPLELPRLGVHAVVVEGEVVYRSP